jgi:hypothetical protein
MTHHDTPESQIPLFEIPPFPQPVYPVHEPPKDKVSEAYYDLGGHSHDLTLAEAEALAPQRLEWKQGARLLARARDLAFYERQLGHYSEPDDAPNRVPVLSSQDRGMQASLAEAAMHLANKAAGGDPRGQTAILAARLQRRSLHV